MGQTIGVNIIDLGVSRGPSRVGRTAGFVRTLARRKPIGFLGLLFIGGMLVVAAVPPLFATHSPSQQVADRYQSYCIGPKDTFLCPTQREAGGGVFDLAASTQKGSISQPLGTDKLGRDIYSRMVYGTRIAVYVGFGSVLVSSMLGLLIGVTSGYFGGRYDAAVQRLVDSIMAMPTLVVLLALPAMIGGPTFTKLILILGILGSAGGSRVMRAAVISMRGSQYLDAARTIGATDARIMALHVIPNIFGPLMVQATVSLGGVILAESALSFLGFGVSDPNQPSWGGMLQLGQEIASQRPLQAVWPGLGIALAVFSFNMFGDAMRDLLDPRLRGARGSFG